MSADQNTKKIHEMMSNSWDDATTNIVTLTHSHDYIHDGLRFISHEYNTLTNGSTRYYTIITASKLVHFVPKISSSGELVIRWLESPTVSVNGTSLPMHNRNRNSVNSTGVVFYKDSTVTNDGTEIETIMIGSGKSFGDTRAEEEINLKPNTTYCIKITANAASDYSVNFDFYETS